MLCLFSDVAVQSDNNVHVSLLTDVSYSKPDEQTVTECDISVMFHEDEHVDGESVNDVMPTNVDFFDALCPDDLFIDRLKESASSEIKLCVHVSTVLSVIDNNDCCSINVESAKPDAIVPSNTSACLDDITNKVHFVELGEIIV